SAVEGVAVRAAKQDVGADRAEKQVVRLPAEQNVGAVTTVETIGPVVAVQRVVAAATADGVVALVTVDLICLLAGAVRVAQEGLPVPQHRPEIRSHDVVELGPACGANRHGFPPWHWAGSRSALSFMLVTDLKRERK